jgi:hypothetical protein
MKVRNSPKPTKAKVNVARKLMPTIRVFMNTAML